MERRVRETREAKRNKIELEMENARVKKEKRSAKMEENFIVVLV